MFEKVDLRDFFAAYAMMAILKGVYEEHMPKREGEDVALQRGIAVMAYEQADAMLEVRTLVPTTKSGETQTGNQGPGEKADREPDATFPIEGHWKEIIGG